MIFKILILKPAIYHINNLKLEYEVQFRPEMLQGGPYWSSEEKKVTYTSNRSTERTLPAVKS
jgi:hypothetical protein